MRVHGGEAASQGRNNDLRGTRLLSSHDDSDKYSSRNFAEPELR
jgi:hypothetical protein